MAWEALLKRERLVVLSALAAVTLLAWAWLVDMARGMGGDVGAMAAMAPHAWDSAYVLAMFVMWSVMMVGMMLPSAAPVMLLFAALVRRRRTAPATYTGIALFAAGYAAVWIAFSAAATLAQWALGAAALLTPAMASASASLAGGLFVAAAIYQLTPLKTACLRHCRSPVEFLTRHRRDGPAGPLLMGMHHGLYCLGCCWVLMSLLFALGVMNLVWVAALAIFVFVEKVLPAGAGVGRLGAILMLGAGVALLAG